MSRQKKVPSYRLHKQSGQATRAQNPENGGASPGVSSLLLEDEAGQDENIVLASLSRRAPSTGPSVDGRYFTSGGAHPGAGHGCRSGQPA